MGMNRVAKRLIQSAFTLYAVATISFVLIHQLPGGPLAYLRAQMSQTGQNPESINNLANVYLSFRPDEPLYLQYIDYIGGVLQGDLGTSFSVGEPVSRVLGEAIPWTVFIMGTNLVIAFFVGVTLGGFLAYNEGSRFDISVSVGSTFLQSIPYYVLAIIMLMYLAFYNPFFPTGGRYGANVEPGFSIAFLGSAIHHGALPILSHAIPTIGGWAIGMRSNAIQVRGEDYLRVARLRGLRQSRIATRYVTRNAILPLYTSVMIAIGAAMGGSVITETIFSYPGVGYYMFEAIQRQDFPLMMGGFILITFGVVGGLTIADLTYSRLDPRAGGVGE